MFFGIGVGVVNAADVGVGDVAGGVGIDGVGVGVVFLAIRV